MNKRFWINFILLIQTFVITILLLCCDFTKTYLISEKIFAIFYITISFILIRKINFAKNEINKEEKEDKFNCFNFIEFEQNYNKRS
jgi:hypothetical protein